MTCMKKLLPFLVLCCLLTVSCGTTRNTQRKLEKKALELASLKGAIVETVTMETGVIALKVTFENGLLFDFNKTDLSEDAKASLKDLVKGIEDMPDANIRVYGHTDNIGSDEANQAVSSERAKTVAAFLEKEGISGDHIVTEGLSSKYPAADNSTEAGRAKNRRVEIYVIPAQ